MAETFAAESADQFLHHLEYLIRGTWDNYVNNGSSSTIPESKPTEPGTVTWTVLSNTKETLYKAGGASPPAGLYRVIRYVDEDDDDVFDVGSEVMDFEGIMKVWRDQVTVPTATGNTPLAYSVAVALNLELSWPAALPAARRETSTVRLELFQR